jgi:hypothetical protein
MTRCVLCYERWRLGEKRATSIRVYIVMKLNITNGRLSLTYIRCAYITRQHKTLAITDAHFNEVSRINCTDSSRYSSQQGGLFVNSTPRNTPLSRRTMHLSHNRMRAEIEKKRHGYLSFSSYDRKVDSKKVKMVKHGSSRQHVVKRHLEVRIHIYCPLIVGVGAD